MHLNCDKCLELVDLVNKHKRERLEMDKLKAWKLAGEIQKAVDEVGAAGANLRGACGAAAVDSNHTPRQEDYLQGELL